MANDRPVLPLEVLSPAIIILEDWEDAAIERSPYVGCERIYWAIQKGLDAQRKID